MKIAVTGHRPERIRGHEKEIYEWFKEKFAELRPSEVITGMAQGVDQIAASAARNMGLNYLCVYPYKRTILNPVEQELVESSSGVIYLSDKYFKGCFVARDKFMVNRANGVLAVWDGIPGGGTYYTMNYASDHNKLEDTFIIKE